MKARGELLRRSWPPALASRAGVARVFLVECLFTSPRAFRWGKVKAHAHNIQRVICYRDAVALADPEIAIHELAHLISGQGHTERFRRVYRDLGGTVQRYLEARAAAKGAARHRWAGGDTCQACGTTRTFYYTGFTFIGYAYTYPDKGAGYMTTIRRDCSEVQKAARP